MSVHRAATRNQGYMWNPQVEAMPRAQLAALQTQHLQQQVTRAYERVPFYRQALEERGVHPQDIQLLTHPGLTSNYQIIVDRERDQLDELEVRVEVDEALHDKGSAAIGTLQANVAEDLGQALGLHAHVLLVEPHHLPRSEGKVKRVVDRRQLTS